MQKVIDDLPPPWLIGAATTNQTMKATVATLTEEDLIAARKKLASLKKKQDELRTQELEIRTYLADVLHNAEEGSKTVTVGSVKLTIKRVLNYSISRADAEKLTQENPDLSLEVLSWSPVVKVGGYKEHASEVAEYITVKPGPPSVEFKD